VICEMCGCTDEMACIDIETGEPCHWTRPGLCSCCDELGGPGLAIRSWPLPEAPAEDASTESIGRQIAAWSRTEQGQRVLDEIFDEGTAEVSAEKRYCGDPTYWVCLDRGLAPLPKGAR